MAFSKQTSLQQELEEEITCTICMEVYNESEKLPKQLSCGHTYCMVCIMQYADQYLTGDINCPTCQVAINLRPNEVGNLSNNLVIMSLIGRLKKIKKCGPQLFPQVKCERHDENCKRVCINCKIGICPECLDDFVESGENPHAKHKTKLLVDLIKEKNDMLQQIQTEFQTNIEEASNNSIFREKSMKWKSAVQKTIKQTKSHFREAHNKLDEIEKRSIGELEGSIIMFDPPDIQSRFKNEVEDIESEIGRLRDSLNHIDFDYNEDFLAITTKCETLKKEMNLVLQESVNKIPIIKTTTTVKIGELGVEFTTTDTKVHGNYSFPTQYASPSGTVQSVDSQFNNQSLASKVNNKYTSGHMTKKKNIAEQYFGGRIRSPGGRSEEPMETMSDGNHKKEEECLICMDTIWDPRTLRCKHTFCSGCIDQSFAKTKPACPICGEVYGKITGTQPHGNMHHHNEKVSLSGYEAFGSIVIDYDIPSGTQGSDHPNPGKPYTGLRRQAYLPDNPEGRHCLQLLRQAFKAKLVFTIGRSVTTGRDNMVTWNDIHHKTSRYGGPQKFGYPDPTYLSRLKEELAAKGIK